MTNTEAAQTMRDAARRLAAWGRAFRQLTPAELESMTPVLVREADRLLAAANELHPIDSSETQTNRSKQ